MASRPCRTYSFSWMKGWEEREVKQETVSHHDVRTRAENGESSDGRSYLSGDSSASKPLFIQVLFRACRYKFRVETQTHGLNINRWRRHHLRQTQVESKTVRLKQHGGRSWELVRRLHSLLLGRLQPGGKTVIRGKNVVVDVCLSSSDTFLSPRSSSASWGSTLKSRNQVSNQATTKEVMGNT